MGRIFQEFVNNGWKWPLEIWKKQFCCLLKEFIQKFTHQTSPSPQNLQISLRKFPLKATLSHDITICNFSHQKLIQYRKKSAVNYRCFASRSHLFIIFTTFSNSNIRKLSGDLQTIKFKSKPHVLRVIKHQIYVNWLPFFCCLMSFLSLAFKQS